jgi:hypothetical protein
MLKSRLAAVLVFGGVLHVFGTIWIVVIPFWAWLSSVWGIFKLAAYNVLALTVFFCYFKSLLTDPGTVPPGWTPEGAEVDLEMAKSRRETIRRDFRIKIRYCSICQHYKPPRTHHCKICNRCVLKMDHHCPWLNNCIGFFNQKYYLLFLLYFVLHSIFASIIFGTWIYEIYHQSFKATHEIKKEEIAEEENLHLKLSMVAISITYLLISTSAMLTILSKQIPLVLQNLTSIEIWEKYWAEQDCHILGLKYNYPWNLGYFENLKEVFGHSVLSWPVPSLPEGDGVNFRGNGKPETEPLEGGTRETPPEQLSSPPTIETT